MGGKVLDYEAKDILNRGIEQGIEQGMSIGKKEAAIENAKEFFHNGASYELVCASIKILSDEDLQAIYKSIKN